MENNKIQELCERIDMLEKKVDNLEKEMKDGFTQSFKLIKELFESMIRFRLF
jgi:chaperonin cofactor prefoldin